MHPNFFIVGAPKAGTTYLYNMLKQHPDVFFPDRKELNHFSAWEIQQQRLYYEEKVISDHDEYISLYQSASFCPIRGVASVSYLFYPKVPGRIFKSCPDARILIMLRNPCHRAFSHYLMDERLGYVDVPFSEIIFKGKADLRLSLYYQQYVELGLYAEQVKRYLDVFGREQLHVILFERARGNWERTLSDIYAFLGIPDSFMPVNEAQNPYRAGRNAALQKVYKNRRIRRFLKALLPQKLRDRLLDRLFPQNEKPKMSGEVLAELRHLYRKDTVNLGKLLNADILNMWGMND